MEGRYTVYGNGKIVRQPNYIKTIVPLRNIEGEEPMTNDLTAAYPIEETPTDLVHYAHGGTLDKSTGEIVPVDAEDCHSIIPWEEEEAEYVPTTMERRLEALMERIPVEERMDFLSVWTAFNHGGRDNVDNYAGKWITTDGFMRGKGTKVNETTKEAEDYETQVFHVVAIDGKECDKMLGFGSAAIGRWLNSVKTAFGYEKAFIPGSGPGTGVPMLSVPFDFRIESVKTTKGKTYNVQLRKTQGIISKVAPDGKK